MKKILVVAIVAFCITAIRVSGQGGETPPPWRIRRRKASNDRRTTARFIASKEARGVHGDADQRSVRAARLVSQRASADARGGGTRPQARSARVRAMSPATWPRSSRIGRHRGAPADYIVEQMHAYRDGRRKSSVGNSIMIALSKAATEEEMRARRSTTRR